MCECVLYVCLSERARESWKLTESEAEVFPHHTKNLTPVSFSVLWCAELYIVSHFIVPLAFMSHRYSYCSFLNSL